MPQPWWPPPAPARRWPAAVLTSVATLVATAALIMVLTQTGVKTPTYTAAQRAEAKKELCDQYELAVQSASVETNIPENTALARISLDNGAAMLEVAAANPALDANYRDAAKAFAAAMRIQTAMGTRGSDPADFAAIDQANAKRIMVEELCSG